jgi:hypothetical protein
LKGFPSLDFGRHSSRGLFSREVAYKETDGLNKQRFIIERGESEREHTEGDRGSLWNNSSSSEWRGDRENWSLVVTLDPSRLSECKTDSVEKRGAFIVFPSTSV